MDFPLTKKAGVVGSAIKVLNHPGTTAAATALSLAPMVSDMVSSPAPAPVRKKQMPTQSQDGEMTRLSSFPTLKVSWIQAAIGAASLASTALSLLPSKAPAAPAKAPAPASFTNNNDMKVSAIVTPEGAVDTTTAVQPIEHPPAPSAASPRTVPKSQMSAGAPKSFKVANLLTMPKFKSGLDTASQLAVIGASALPFYAMYQDSKQQKEDQGLNPAAELRALQAGQPDSPLRKTSIASLLPLRPKSSIMSRISDGVKDFGEGAYDALDHSAEQMLTPNMQLDPATHRIPPISHSI